MSHTSVATAPSPPSPAELSPDTEQKIDDMMAANGKNRERLWALYFFSRCKSLGRTAKHVYAGHTSTARRNLNVLAIELAKGPDGQHPKSSSIEPLIENDDSRERRVRLTSFGQLVVKRVGPKFKGDYRRKTGEM